MWQIILGPVLGVFGGLAQGWLDIKKTKAQSDARIEERKFELVVMEREAELATKRLTVEQELKTQQVENEAFMKSYSVGTSPLLPKNTVLSHAQSWVALLVDAFSTAIRPGATVFYQMANIGVFAWAAYVLSTKGVELIDSVFAQELVRTCVYSVIGMAEMTLGWYFGIRGMSTRGKK